MLKDKVLSIIGVLFFITAFVFSIIIFPFFMSGWAVALCIFGSAFAILGFLLAFYDAFYEKKTWAYIPKIVFCGIGIAMLVLTLIVVGFIALATNLENKRQASIAPVAETVVEAAVISDPTDVADPVTETVAVPTIPVTDPALDHGTLPQEQKRHPNFYAETGKGSDSTKKWTIEVKEGEIGIVSGYIVDGVDKGVIRAFGPGTYTVTVTDGFILTINQEWGFEEFEFRVNENISNGWAHDTIDYGPLKAPSK